MGAIVNIAGYKFVSLTDLAILRQRIYQQCTKLCLKGTVLLSNEGINITLAGIESAITTFITSFSHEEKFADIVFKKSYSEKIPFQRLQVKIKKEIITFNVPNIAPEKITGKHLAPQQFKQWLDQQKELVVLDVRNQCEITAGTFMNAIDLGINNFSSFPEATQKLGNAIKQKTLVMYCTGGIRCEKASAYLLQQGYEDVYQLDGGILRYFQECGAAHFNGKCFVFDEREVVEG
jgi:UPF0176 protein